MKSLILKDIYNIMHNMKALVLMLFIFLFITIPQAAPRPMSSHAASSAP